ncbi:MAG: hypothetical protein OEX77_06955 [Candidatus Bathyarchaeota archaeon]|nr:hypothetical protein [Candidatus Bathyarchaeota archaeon]MDH5732468.1 hypothetical protein [Candidatus Bathyarchaeota archaeon]
MRAVEMVDGQGTTFRPLVIRHQKSMVSPTCACLIEEFADHQRDTIDGLEVFHDGNWVLIHPSTEEPVINLFAKAPSKEVADNLIQEYGYRIRGLV